MGIESITSAKPRARKASGSEDDLDLDLLACRGVILGARRERAVDDVVLGARHAQGERVRVAVHGEEGVARAVARGVGVGLRVRRRMGGVSKTFEYRMNGEW